jgi:hypothetical protein
MGMITRTAMYATFFALGFAVCYSSCSNKDYKIIEENGKMYVQDRYTGKRQKIDTDFKEQSAPPKKDIAGKVEEAYKILVK